MGTRLIHYQASQPAPKTGTATLPATSLLDTPITSRGVQLSILK